MKRQLSGKTAIVTGAARGIGYQIAKALVAEGATVAIGDIDETVLKGAASELGVAFYARLDVSDPYSIRSFIDDVERDLGPLDILVNNAGIMPTGHMHEESDQVARRTLEINTLGVIAGTKRAVQSMLPRGTGHVVNVASMAGETIGAGVATYCGSKFAVVGFTDACAFEYHNSGIEFTLVLPAFVNTELTSGSTGVKLIPTVQPEDVAASVIAALKRPKRRVYVPKVGGALMRAQRVVPRKTMEAINRRLGGDKALLADIDTEKRAAYEARARNS